MNKHGDKNSSNDNGVLVLNYLNKSMFGFQAFNPVQVEASGSKAAMKLAQHIYSRCLINVTTSGGR